MCIRDRSETILKLFDSEVSETATSGGKLEQELDPVVSNLLAELRAANRVAIQKPDSAITRILSEDAWESLLKLEQAADFYQASRKLEYDSSTTVSEQDRRTQERAIVLGNIAAITLLETNTRVARTHIESIGPERG